MENKTLIILRGVSGAGKTTVANLLLSLDEDHTISVAADDYHYDAHGVYNFDIDLIGAAHGWCKDRVFVAMESDIPTIIVHNTNTSEKEIKPYIDMAEAYGYSVISLIVEHRHDNTDVHNVPSEVKVNQEKRLRNSIKLV